MPPSLLKIDPSNIGDHYYLKDEHECFFFYEYTSGKGFGYSQGNQFISNLKKSVLRRDQQEYQYKEQAIVRGSQLLRPVLLASPAVLPVATVSSIPPSKVSTDPEYDDRMHRVIALACANTAAEARDLIVQTTSYAASHTQASGGRKKPHELVANYAMFPPPPRQTVILVDDVLTTGAHFVAAREVILSHYPATRVVGIFMARRVIANPFDDVDPH